MDWKIRMTTVANSKGMMQSADGQRKNMLAVMCDSAAVRSGDISATLAVLEGFSVSRFRAMNAAGAVTLVFTGYDHDRRELASIPEVRIWFSKLFEAWPYWSFFATSQTVPLLLFLLLPGQSLPAAPGMFSWGVEHEALIPLVMKMFRHQEELTKRLALGEAANERAMQHFYDAVKSTFV
jgi:hypothetical protein